jgi:hypothetical protein
MDLKNRVEQVLAVGLEQHQVTCRSQDDGRPVVEHTFDGKAAKVRWTPSAGGPPLRGILGPGHVLVRCAGVLSDAGFKIDLREDVQGRYVLVTTRA